MFNESASNVKETKVSQLHSQFLKTFQQKKQQTYCKLTVMLKGLRIIN